jgi:hypothetical protein
MKRFTVWLEGQLEKDRIIHIFLDRLGYKKDALDGGRDIIETERKMSNIVDAINKINIGEENKHKMIKFAQANSKSLSLRALANLIEPDSAEVQDRDVSSPAVIPPANQPAPIPGQQQQMPPPPGSMPMQ